MSTPPPLLGLAEVVLNVADLPAMRRFYREVMGFPVLSEACHTTGIEPDAEGEPTICFLTMFAADSPLGRAGHPQLLVLIDAARHVFARERFRETTASSSTLNHLAWEIAAETFEEHRAFLEEHGLSPREIEFPAMGARALFFEDPEGNELELICPKS
ncbi:MAG: VOC family protein [Acidobacteriota bacterium]